VGVDLEPEIVDRPWIGARIVLRARVTDKHEDGGPEQEGAESSQVIPRVEARVVYPVPAPSTRPSAFSVSPLGTNPVRRDPDDLSVLPDRDRVPCAFVLPQRFADGPVEGAIDLDAFVENALYVRGIVSLVARSAL
jgi:hypothetical protein